MFANPPAECAPLTLVTAYFALPRRSRTVRDYHAWMSNLLPFVEWPLVIFCDAESLAVIKRLRGGKPAASRHALAGLSRIPPPRCHPRARHAATRPARGANHRHRRGVGLARESELRAPRHRRESVSLGDVFLVRHRLAAPRRVPPVAAPGMAKLANPPREICRPPGVFRPPECPPPQNRVWITAEFWGGAAEPTRRFCDAYYRLLDSRISAHPATPGGEPVPPARAYHTEELLFTAMAAGDYGMRVVTKDDLRWPRWLKALAQIRRAPGVDWLRRRRYNPAKTAPQQIGAGNTFITLYLLNGACFPWACLGREIRLRHALRLLAGRIFR